jgi:hypothetical protein
MPRDDFPRTPCYVRGETLLCYVKRTRRRSNLAEDRTALPCNPDVLVVYRVEHFHRKRYANALDISTVSRLR